MKCPGLRCLDRHIHPMRISHTRKYSLSERIAMKASWSPNEKSSEGLVSQRWVYILLCHSYIHPVHVLQLNPKPCKPNFSIMKPKYFGTPLILLHLPLSLAATTTNPNMNAISKEDATLLKALQYRSSGHYTVSGLDACKKAIVAAGEMCSMILSGYCCAGDRQYGDKL